MMTSCQSATDVIAIHGVDKKLLPMFRSYRIDPAEMEAFEADTSGALVGEKIARRYKWKIGQNVTLEKLNGISFNVRGVFSKKGSADDFLILVGRRFLQEAEDKQGESNYVLVKRKPGVEASTVCRAIDDLPLTVQVNSQPEEALLTTILDQLADLVSLSRGVILVIIAVILIAVGNAISMATRDRSREFGILRTLGFSRRAIMAIVVGEGVIQGLIGGTIGCLIVQILAWSHLIRTVSTCAVTVDFIVGAAEWGTVLLVVMLAAAAGSLLPAWSAARLDIVNALRRED
jgi:putative ABC transport system permease protein